MKLSFVLTLALLFATIFILAWDSCPSIPSGIGNPLVWAEETRPDNTGAKAADIPMNKAANSPLARLAFSRAYVPGSMDTNGKFMGGTEAMWLAGHKGRLYAAIGYGQDQPGNDPRPGAQIICKPSHDALWQVDHAFGERCMRVESLVSFHFTTDSEGRKLDAPVPLLVASPSDIIRAGSKATVFVRDDVRNEWVGSDVAEGGMGARALGSHIDRMSGVHYIFAGLNRGEIIRGSYDPTVKGFVKWEPVAERKPVSGYRTDGKVYDFSRILCFAECNGDLYMASRITLDKDGKAVDGGLYRRRDGAVPSWELVYRWPVEVGVLQSRYLRGLTAVPHPEFKDRQVLIAGFEYPGTIARFDPFGASEEKPAEVKVEVDLKDYFNIAWNTPATKRRGVIAAYNRFLPVTDPESGQSQWLCGAWAERPGSPKPPENGSCYLVRSVDGSYEWGYIFDPASPVPSGQRLTGTRDIEPSPFPEEAGRVFYFCGYDGGAGPSHNSAWIYKGQLK